jgi:hypothetical protein
MSLAHSFLVTVIIIEESKGKYSLGGFDQVVMIEARFDLIVACYFEDEFTELLSSDMRFKGV